MPAMVASVASSRSMTSCAPIHPKSRALASDRSRGRDWSAMSDARSGDWVFLKIVGRQHVVGVGDESLEKAPGAPRGQAQALRVIADNGSLLAMRAAGSRRGRRGKASQRSASAPASSAIPPPLIRPIISANRR